MKPDLGLQLLRDGIGDGVSLNFYGVSFCTIDFLAPHSYSTMLEHEHAGKTYAVSFDYDDDTFTFLVAQLPSLLQDDFGKNIIGNSFPVSVNLPFTVEVSSLQCQLGSVQHGAHDSFVPLTVVGFA